MNYRHAYHAGNFADVMKHAALALTVEYLKQKEKPFFILDTHAGTGATDLSGEEAQKTGEYRDGIARVLAQATPHPALAPYLAALKALGFDGAAAMRYPGSPLIARGTSVFLAIRAESARARAYALDTTPGRGTTGVLDPADFGSQRLYAPSESTAT